VAPWNHELERFLGSWPPELCTEFRSYWCNLRSARCQRGEPRPSAPTTYWLLLPGWLASRYEVASPAARRIAVGLLPEVIWGQYTLFIAIRIQDDLFDGQTGSHALVFASGLFLVESARRFAAVCGDVPGFWQLYGESLGKTTRGILETDLLQKAGECPVDSLLLKYAEVSSIFKVGSAALCMLAGRFDEFGYVSRFCDEMAKVSQIFDDLEDVLEDLGRGRSNYVARCIGLRSTPPLSGEQIEDVLEKWLRDESAQVCLLREIRKYIAAAEESITPLELPGAGTYILRQRRAVDALEEILSPASAEGLSRQLFRPGGIASLMGSLSVCGWSG